MKENNTSYSAIGRREQKVLKNSSSSRSFRDLRNISHASKRRRRDDPYKPKISRNGIQQMKTSENIHDRLFHQK